MSTVAELKAVLTANATQFNAEMAKVRGELETTKGATSAFASAGKFAFLGLAGAAGVLGTVAVKQAMEQEEATTRLRVAIKNTGAAYKDYAKDVEKASDAAINLGFDDADLASSLARLVSATHDTKKAMADMALAEDIARARHMTLQQATDLLAKVETGHVALLGRMGINTKEATATEAQLAAAHLAIEVAQKKADEATKKYGATSIQAREASTKFSAAQEKLNGLMTKGGGATISSAEAIKRLTDMYGGQAKAYTETFAGKIEVLKAQLGEMAEKIGFVLIPILIDLGAAVSRVITWFEKHRDVALALGIAIGVTLVALVGVWVASMLVAAATTIAAFWPILIPIAAIALALGGLAFPKAFEDTYYTYVVPVLNEFIRDTNTLIDGWNELFGWLGLGIGRIGEITRATAAWKNGAGDMGPPTPGSWGTGPNDMGPQVPAFASGGPVPGPMGAPMLAVVHGGEYVIPNGGSAPAGGVTAVTVSVPWMPGFASVIVDEINRMSRGSPVLLSAALR